MLELVGLMSEDRQGERSGKFWNLEITEREISGKRSDNRSKNRRIYVREEVGPVTTVLMSREFEVGSRGKSIAEASANRIGGKSIFVLQVNCRSVYKKNIIILEFS
jgi:hypothetical protein